MDQLAASLKLLTRAVPVLLIFMIVLFINTEMWQVFSDVSEPALLGVIASYRAEFLDDLQTSLRETFGERARYLEARAGATAP